ncbi:MAG: nicotinamide riboside transporter PnuC [Cytophagales bacterium]|nr:nicotinamide riboside transporter PnuC [Cytophagales bacterium]
MELAKFFASPFETIGFITGIICIWYNTKGHMYGWPFAIISVSSYAVVFYESKLYADMSLQLVYLSLSIYGWWQWKKGAVNNKIKPRNLPSRISWLYVLGSIGIFTLAISFLIGNLTDSDVPWLDAFTTGSSLVAQYLMNIKITQHWIVWIVADIVYIGLYAYKELYLTTLLYIIITGLAVYGYFNWKKM